MVEHDPVQTGYMGNKNAGDIGDKEPARSGTSGREIGEWWRKGGSQHIADTSVKGQDGLRCWRR
jgi:hypothetical protein